MGMDSQSVSLTPSQNVVAVVTTERGITGSDVTVVNHFQCGRIPVWDAQKGAFHITEEDMCVPLAPFAGTTAAPFSQWGNAAITAAGAVGAAAALRPDKFDGGTTNNSSSAEGGDGGDGGAGGDGGDSNVNIRDGGGHHQRPPGHVCPQTRNGCSRPVPRKNWGHMGGS